MNTRIKDNLTLVKAIADRALELKDNCPAMAERLSALSRFVHNRIERHIWSFSYPKGMDLSTEVNHILSDIVYETTYPYASETSYYGGTEICYIVQGVLAKDLELIVDWSERGKEPTESIND